MSYNLRNDVTSTKYAIQQIYKQLETLQPKLIPGQGITIDENNVISSTGGGGSTNVEYHTTEYYNQHSSEVYSAGTIIVYSDYKRDEQGRDIPGMKISDGLAYVADLPFTTQNIEEMITQLSQTISSLSQLLEEKSSFWDNKINVDNEVLNETLVINRN